MKSFFKYTLASLVGVIIAGLLFFLIFFTSISIMLSKQDKPVEINPNTVLKVKLDNIIMDRNPKSPFGNFDFQSFKPQPSLGLNEILANIEKAGEDDNIEGIYLELTSIPAGMATIEEIREALIKFKETGKFIIAYSDNYVQTSYYLASVADKIYVNPAGRINLTGLNSQVMFFKEALDKLGIEPQIIRHGKFKSAIEPFTRNEMSEENRTQIMEYVSDLWSTMAEGIEEFRGIDNQKINELADNLSLETAEIALEQKFVDGLKYKDEILGELKDSSKTDKDDVDFVNLNKYNRVPEIKDYKGLATDKIAVVYAMGSVIMGEGEEGSIGSDRISRAIREARKDSTIKAIVFRVNSGGGSALASEVIWRELKLASETKPVIASLGDVAASGGYYIVAPADTIVANPNTITGSIGVFGIIPNVKELMNDKLGIYMDVAKTNKHSDIGNPFRSLTDYEKQVIKNGIEDVYDNFVGRVADGRNMTKEEVDEIGQGRVWSGIDAKNIGLVDLFGGLDKAIEIAGEKAKIEKYRVVELPELKDPFDQFMKQIKGGAKTRIIKNALGDEYTYYEQLEEVKNMSGIQARIPYKIEIY
ncbi:MAG: signal peptide peptidase SppA [Bacteroidales bacterium]